MIPHEHCLVCAPKRAKLADHDEPCYYCKQPTNEFEMRWSGCSRMGHTEYRQHRHQTCADKAAAELAERNRIQQEQWHREWKEKNGDKPYPVLTFVPLKMEFNIKDEELLCFPFPIEGYKPENCTLRELNEEKDKYFMSLVEAAVKKEKP